MYNGMHWMVQLLWDLLLRRGRVLLRLAVQERAVAEVRELGVPGLIDKRGWSLSRWGFLAAPPGQNLPNSSDRGRFGFALAVGEPGIVRLLHLRATRRVLFEHFALRIRVEEGLSWDGESIGLVIHAMDLESSPRRSACRHSAQRKRLGVRR